MPAKRLVLELRAALMDDAEMVADLESTFDPEDPRDSDLLRFWWRNSDANQVVMRQVVESNDRAVAFIAAGHDRWENDATRFGWLHPVLLHELWSDSDFADLVRVGETWLRSEGAAFAVTRFREDDRDELDMLDRLGYREVRRQNVSQLDLEAGRERLMEAARHQRKLMHEQGVTMHTLDRDPDPEVMRKLYQTCIAAERDTPTTVPWRIDSFDQWQRSWFDNPAVRKDRFWIARQQDSVVGLSVLQFPVRRGLPWTAFTGTARSVRGRGVARALKYESVAQAIGLGYKRVRTMNDGANEPILHLNREMGYRLVVPMIELHLEIAT